MVSLTTVYIVSVILTSIAGMGSAFAAKKFVGGGEIQELVPQAEEPIPQTEESIPQTFQEESPEPSTEQIQPEVPLAA
jgi:hypothetical protein